MAALFSSASRFCKTALLSPDRNIDEVPAELVQSRESRIDRLRKCAIRAVANERVNKSGRRQEPASTIRQSDRNDTLEEDNRERSGFDWKLVGRAIPV